MNLTNSFKLALRGLLINKGRSALTLLGIVIGIAAVITITSLAEGLRAQAARQIDQLGTNLIFIFPQMSENERRTQAGRQGFYTPKMFTEKEFKAVMAGQRTRGTGTAFVQQETTVTFGRQSVTVPVTGVDENYATVYNENIANGRLFTPAEINGAQRVCTLGYQTAIDLFGNQDPIGHSVQIGSTKCTVIGVSKEVGGGLGQNPDKQALVPLRLAQNRIFGVGDQIFIITIKVNDIADMETVKTDAKRALNRIRRIDDPKDENYSLMSQTDALEQFGQFVKILTMVLGGVAAVSLLVGGIGIMNIMLVNVTERTREIGLRKAVGARQVDILFQFLIEAVVLCVLGGIVGMAFGYMGAMGLSSLIRNALPEAAWDPVISAMSVAIAVLFSSMIGVIFGVYPAVNAAKKDPILALRFE